MANLHVGEYADIGSTSRGPIPIPVEPPVTEQSIEIGSTSKQSLPLDRSTCIIKLVSDVDCAIALGSDPDATDSVRFLAAGQEQTLAVLPDTKLKVAVMAAGSGSMSDSLGSFLKIIADPAEAQKRLDDLKSHAAEIDASTQSLRDSTAAFKQAKSESEAAAQAASEQAAAANKAITDLANEKDQIQADHNTLASQRQAAADALAVRDKALSDREASVAAMASSLSAKEASLDDTAKTLDVREQSLSDRESAANALKADYEARIAKLKALTA